MDGNTDIQRIIEELRVPDKWEADYRLFKEHVGIGNAKVEDEHGECLVAETEVFVDSNLKRKFEDDSVERFVFIANFVEITMENRCLMFEHKDMSVKIWNLIEKQEASSFIGHSAAITSLLVLKNNKYMVSASEDFTIMVWDLRTIY